MFFLLIQFHNILYSIILSFTFLTDLRVTTLIDSLIDWLLVSWTQCLSLTGHTRFLTSIGCLSLSAVCWFDWLTLENEHWLRLRLANEAHHFFVLIEWRHLILFGKWQQTDKNESIVIVMVQWSLCPHLTSNRVHSLTDSINAILAQKSHNIYITRTIFHLTEWLDYYWINETNILTLVFKFNRSSNQTFFFYLTLRETLT